MPDRSPHPPGEQRRNGEYPVPPDELRMRHIIDCLPAGAYTCDADGLITYFNQHAERLWGRAPRLKDPVDRFCGSFKLYNAAGTPIEQDECWMALALRNEQRYDAEEIVIERPDGTRRTVLAHANPIYDENGRLIGAVNVLTDITERKRAELARKEQEERYQAAMEGSLNAFFILRAVRDDDGEIVDFTFVDLNSRGEELIGIQKETAVGGRLLDLLPANRDLGFFDKYKRIVETREPLVEEFGECAAGHVDAWFWQQVVPLGDGIAITTADFRDRKRTELELQERLRQQTLVHELSTAITRARSTGEIYDTALNAILDATHADRAAILLFDTDGVIRFKAWRGLSDDYRAAVEGHSPWQPNDTDAAPIAVSSVRKDDALVAYRDVILGEGIRALAFIPLAYEDRVLGKFMVYADAERTFSASQLQLAQTVANHVAFAIERKRSEQALALSERQYRVLSETLEQRVSNRTRELARANEMLALRNRELQDFAYVASHDLQEPLRKFRTFLDLLEAELQGASESVRDYIRRMDASARRMSELITALLALSRVTTRTERFQETDLDTVVREVLADLEVSIAEADADVKVEHLETVEADPTQIRQLFQNLIGNALKFRSLRECPELRISGERGVIGDGVPACRITVWDNGIGFDQKYAERIFAPFQRLHGRERYPGTGMGLAICRRIVERHGGTIEVTSAPGAGTAFTVTLPLQQPTAKVSI